MARGKTCSRAGEHHSSPLNFCFLICKTGSQQIHISQGCNGASLHIRGKACIVHPAKVTTIVLFRICMPVSMTIPMKIKCNRNVVKTERYFISCVPSHALLSPLGGCGMRTSHRQDSRLECPLCPLSELLLSLWSYTLALCNIPLEERVPQPKQQTEPS